MIKHFALFSNTPPVNPSIEPRAVRLVIQRMDNNAAMGGGFDGNGLSLGLDTAQVRRLSVGPHATLWLIPGSEQVCHSDEQAGADRGSCGPVSSLLRYGAIMGTGGVLAHHRLIYRIGGFVPNGNASVTIKLASGVAHVPVKHNAFVASFKTEPLTVTFKDATGKTVTDPAPGPNDA